MVESLPVDDGVSLNLHDHLPAPVVAGTGERHWPTAGAATGSASSFWEVSGGSGHTRVLTTTQIQDLMVQDVSWGNRLARPMDSSQPPRPVALHPQLLPVEAAIDGLARALDSDPAPETARRLVHAAESWFKILEHHQDVSHASCAQLLGLIDRSASRGQTERLFQLALADCPPARRPGIYTHLARLYLCGDAARLGQAVQFLVEAVQSAPPTRLAPRVNLKTALDLLDKAAIREIPMACGPVQVANLRREYLQDGVVSAEQAAAAERNLSCLDRVPVLAPERIAAALSAGMADPVGRMRRHRAVQAATAARTSLQEADYSRAATLGSLAAELEPEFRPLAASLVQLRDQQRGLVTCLEDQHQRLEVGAAFDRALVSGDLDEAQKLFSILERRCQGKPEAQPDLDLRRSRLRQALASKELADVTEGDPVAPESLPNALADEVSCQEASHLLARREAATIQGQIDQALQRKDFAGAWGAVRQLRALGPEFHQHAGAQETRTRRLAQAALRSQAAEAAGRGDLPGVNRVLAELVQFDSNGELSAEIRDLAAQLRQEAQRAQLRCAESELLSALEEKQAAAAVAASDRLRAIHADGRAIAMKHQPAVRALQLCQEAAGSEISARSRCLLLRQAYRLLRAYSANLAAELTGELWEAELEWRCSDDIDRILANQRWQKIRAKVPSQQPKDDVRWLREHLAGSPLIDEILPSWWSRCRRLFHKWFEPRRP